MRQFEVDVPSQYIDHGSHLKASPLDRNHRNDESKDT